MTNVKPITRQTSRRPRFLPTNFAADSRDEEIFSDTQNDAEQRMMSGDNDEM